MTTYRILPEALAELGAAAVWYEQHEEGLGLDISSVSTDDVSRGP